MIVDIIVVAVDFVVGFVVVAGVAVAVYCCPGWICVKLFVYCCVVFLVRFACMLL